MYIIIKIVNCGYKITQSIYIVTYRFRFDLKYSNSRFLLGTCIFTLSFDSVSTLISHIHFDFDLSCGVRFSFADFYFQNQDSNNFKFFYGSTIASPRQKEIKKITKPNFSERKIISSIFNRKIPSKLF